MPQTSVMKVITGKGQTRRTLPKDNKGPQVGGSNQYGPSENTRSQTKDRRIYSTQATIASYEKVVVDAITFNSESGSADKDVNQISEDEVSHTAEEQLSMEGESDEEQ